MASVTPVEEIQDEIKCPICLKYLTDPVSIHCGHNFCRVCITQYYETWAEGDYDPVRCPNCRALIQKGTLRPNWQLANIVNKIKHMDLKPGKEKLCKRHNKTLDLFCEEDGEALCVVCERSPEHGAHTVILMEEAAQKYKVGNSLDPRVLSHSSSPASCLSPQGESLGSHTKGEFLQKWFPLPQLKNCNDISAEAHAFSTEAARWVPGSQPEQGCLGSVRNGPGLSYAPNNLILSLSSVNVILDPDTAHPVLVLSDDQKSVRWGDTRQDLPDNPERFDTELCVLGCEGFTSGKHSWEVEEVDEGHWAVGVARESVRRKGVISRNPQGGIWAVGPWGDQFKALTSMETPLPLSWVPKRIQIFLDYEKGQVTFFDVDKEAPIFTFPPASFTGERIYPWLWVWGSHSLPALLLRPHISKYCRGSAPAALPKQRFEISSVAIPLVCVDPD
uniref:Zinc finger protein RFP-like n=1 Tax=Chelonoidis abingdonii TaxID=106734 RepID=A0A8C0J4J6_CHEAB